jgi:hypothetical protein
MLYVYRLRRSHTDDALSLTRGCGVGIKSSHCQEVDFLAPSLPTCTIAEINSRFKRRKTEALAKEKLQVAAKRSLLAPNDALLESQFDVAEMWAGGVRSRSTCFRLIELDRAIEGR